jgi:hypothetical protein
MTERDEWRIKAALRRADADKLDHDRAVKRAWWKRNSSDRNAARRERYATDPDYRMMRLGYDKEKTE